MQNIIVRLRGVRKEYAMGQVTVAALRGVDMTLERGGLYAVVGPSGSGKSSLLHIIGCMDRPTHGTVWIQGQETHRLKARALTKIRARDIGFIFQAFHLTPMLTAHENVAIALRLIGEPKKVALEKAAHWLDRVGLAHRLHHYPAELSGGERQRVAIARAIVKSPALILADEPTGNLDTACGQEIMALLRDISCEQHATVVLVTHNLEIAQVSDAILTLRDGKFQEQDG